MKKVLVFMLILAVTAGVFAQETITIQGETVTEVTTYTVVRSTETIVDPYTYTEVRGVWSVNAKAGLETTINLIPNTIPIGAGSGNGEVSLSYKKDLEFGNLNISFSGIKRDGFSGVGFGAEGKGLSDRYLFKITGSLGVNEGAAPGFFPIGFNAGDVFGWYQMFNNMIKMMVSVQGNPGGIASYGDVGSGNFGVNVTIGDLQFGGILTDVFTPGIDLVDTFKRFIFGIKYDAGIFAANAWFQAYDDMKVHFGVDTSVGPVDISLKFDGKFNAPAEAGLELDLSYDGGSFAGGIDIPVEILPDFILGLKPWFWVNVIPENLNVRVDTKFIFGLGDTRTVEWQLKPAFTWNFLNNGAKHNYGDDIKTGMQVVYNIEGDDSGITTNGITFQFKWGL